MTKVMGNQIKWNPQQRKGKRKNSTRSNQETWAKENQKNEIPKKEMGKIQEMDSNWGYSQAWEVILDFRKPFKEFHSQNILPLA